jgi:hypothetical protein
MRHSGVADDVGFEETELGWVMTVYTEDGDEFRFRIHHLAWEHVDYVDATLGVWRREGEQAKAMP